MFCFCSPKIQSNGKKSQRERFWLHLRETPAPYYGSEGGGSLWGSMEVRPCGRHRKPSEGTLRGDGRSHPQGGCGPGQPVSNNGRDRLDDSGEQRRFLFVFESRLQPEPFLRAFTSKAAAGILLLQSVLESDFTRS